VRSIDAGRSTHEGGSRFPKRQEVLCVLGVLLRTWRNQRSEPVVPRKSWLQPSQRALDRVGENHRLGWDCGNGLLHLVVCGDILRRIQSHGKSYLRIDDDLLRIRNSYLTSLVIGL